MARILFCLKLIPFGFLVASCQSTDLMELTDRPLSFIKEGGSSIVSAVFSEEQNSSIPVNKSLNELLEGQNVSAEFSSGFKAAITSAINSDPIVIVKRKNLKSLASGIDVIKSSKEFQVSGSLYGGVEDITDHSNGAAVVLDATRMLYDGGLIDAQILSKQMAFESSEYDLQRSLNERSGEIMVLWVELRKYTSLNENIDARLEVLKPLIEQVERVAEAGLGDVTQVATAQRTISKIRVVKTDVFERLQQVRVNFVDAYGDLPGSTTYDARAISKLVPKDVSQELVLASPAVQADYSAYQAAQANVMAATAKDSYSVGFQSRFSRPFGSSGVDSDEQIGLVLNKTLFNGNKIDAELAEVTARVQASESKLRATYREAQRLITNARQNIKSMNIAVNLARENAKVTSDEIAYLKRQLVIGESTLDRVLSSEASLYEAETQEINYMAEKEKSELIILGATGILAKALGLSAGIDQD
jgi:outer membrane protein TolC